jgi:hypothetical protein
MEIVPASKDITIIRGVEIDPFIVVLSDQDGNQIDLTGYSAFGQVRKKPGGSIVLDLMPTIMATGTSLYGTTGPGRVLLGGYTTAQTLAMANAALFWDVVVQDPLGERHGPAAQGKWNIVTIITEPN